MKSSVDNEFLDDSKLVFAERGTLFMVDVIEAAVASDYESISDLVIAERAAMHSCDAFSIEFMYHWSVMTYWQSLGDCQKKVEIGVDCGTKYP